VRSADSDDSLVAPALAGLDAVVSGGSGYPDFSR
jgi:hypothetical protein